MRSFAGATASLRDDAQRAEKDENTDASSGLKLDASRVDETSYPLFRFALSPSIPGAVSHAGVMK